MWNPTTAVSSGFCPCGISHVRQVPLIAQGSEWKKLLLDIHASSDIVEVPSVDLHSMTVLEESHGTGGER
jgi:hypothetical protein